MDEKEQEKNKYNLLSELEIELLTNFCNVNIMQRISTESREKLETRKEQMKEKAKVLYSAKSKSKEYIEQVTNLIESTCSELINNRERQQQEQGQEYSNGIERNIRDELKVDVSDFNNSNINFSELDRPDLLSTAKDANKYGRRKREDIQSYEFVWNSEKITIANIGIMKYTTAVGVEEYLNEYQVDRYDENGNLTHSDNVFTYLVIQRLSSDKNYRDIVFDKLLSLQNIHSKDSKGYVGEIANISVKDKKYSIEYVPESYTAVVKLKEALENREAKGKDRKEGEGNNRHE